jgi:hypothetical protein
MGLVMSMLVMLDGLFRHGTPILFSGLPPIRLQKGFDLHTSTQVEIFTYTTDLGTSHSTFHKQGLP